MNAPLLLTLVMLLPLACAGAILLVRRNPNLREAVSVVGGMALFGLVLALTAAVRSGEAVSLELAEPIPGLRLHLSPEPLGLLFAMLASFLWPTTVLFAIGYMRGLGEHDQTRFYTCMALSVTATLGIAMAGDMLTLFLFYEVLTVATYPLVTHAGTAAARRAGRIYLGILMGTSMSMLLLATAITHRTTGTLDFQAGGVFGTGFDPKLLSVVLILFVFGASKAALMPFHRWLPNAMVAPTPVSALLHAVAVVKAGVFTILKVSVYLFGIDTLTSLDGAVVMRFVAAFTILAASLIALRSDNLKLRLAYSTVSQLAYIVMGAMLATSAGMVGSGMHLVMHAFGKITLFFCAGAILVASRRKYVSELDGIGQRMPWTMAAFTIGTLSLIGLPPTGGTWSKWMLLQGTLDAGTISLMVVLLLSALLNLAYLLVIPVRAYFAPAQAAQGKALPMEEVPESPLPCRIALGITSVGCILGFVFPEPLWTFVQEAL